jgi:hypothetical protein
MTLKKRRPVILGTPRGLFGRNGPMAVQSKSVRSRRMIEISVDGLESLQFRARNAELV